MSSIVCRILGLRYVTAVLCVLGGSFSQAQDVVDISTVSQFYDQTPEDADLGQSVQLEGVILYADDAWHQLWFADRTGRLFQPVKIAQADLPSARSRVIITGTTAYRGGEYLIDDIQIKDLRQAGRLPGAKKATQELLNGNLESGARVTVTGTVVFMDRIDDTNLELILATDRDFRVRTIIREASKEEEEGAAGGNSVCDRLRGRVAREERANSGAGSGFCA